MRFIVLFLFMFTLAFADGDDYEENYHMPKDLSFLQLDKAQKNAFKKILKSYRKALEEIHEREEIFEHDLQKLFMAEQFDTKDFMKKNMMLRQSIAEVEATFFKNIHALLNKVQRKKFIRHIEEWEIE